MERRPESAPTDARESPPKSIVTSRIAGASSGGETSTESVTASQATGSVGLAVTVTRIAGRGGYRDRPRRDEPATSIARTVTV